MTIPQNKIIPKKASGAESVLLSYAQISFANETRIQSSSYNNYQVN